MSVIQLNTNNFVETKTPKGRVSLNTNVPGVSMVMFKLANCKGCSIMEPEFASFANDGRLKVATVDLTYNRPLIGMARNSTTPIQKTPHVIMYVDGKPLAIYKSKPGLPIRTNLANFVNGAMSQIPQQTFVPRQQQQNIYGGTTENTNYYTPESNPPRRAINMANESGHGNIHPTVQQQQCDSDDEDCLLTPNKIIPYNQPWECELKKINM